MKLCESGMRLRQVCVCVRNASGMRLRQKCVRYAFPSEKRQKIKIKQLRYF